MLVTKDGALSKKIWQVANLLDHENNAWKVNLLSQICESSMVNKVIRIKVPMIGIVDC